MDAGAERSNHDGEAGPATHDLLTGLPNRLYLQARLRHAGLALGESRWLAVICLSCDRFPTGDTERGRAARDVCLVELADRLRAEIRGADTAALLGGDTFAVLLADLSDVTDAVGIGERLRRILELPVRWSGGEIALSARGGVAAVGAGDPDPQAALGRAEGALGRSRPDGQSRFVVAGPPGPPG
jgi:diguanylate cyclase